MKLSVPAGIVRAWPRLLDVLYGGAILAGTIILFEIDIHSPRGILDGLGYPAIVALCVQFGRRAVLGCAWLVSLLIVMGAFLVPDAGISVAGELANRACGLIAVWIVALVLRQRFSLEHYIATQETHLAQHQKALLEAVQQVLLTNLPLQDRIGRLSEIAAKSLNVGRVGIFRWREDDTKLVCLDMYLNPENRHEIVPDMEENRHPDYVQTMQREMIVSANDIYEAPFLETRVPILARNNVRAVMGAGVALDGELMGQITFSHLNTPRQWTPQEIAYARALANLTAVLFSADRNSERLAALDMVNDGIYATGANGSLLYANRAARRIAAALAQMPEGSTLPASAYPSPGPLEGATDHQEVTIDGTELEIERSRLPHGGIVTRINNVTQRNAAGRARIQLETRLQQAAKLEAIGQLASGMAHDFNNILGAVSGFAGFISQDSAADSQNRDFAQRILNSSKRGKDMVDQIMAFAETQAVARGVANLERIVQASRDLLAHSMHPGAMLEIEMPNSPLLVRGNEVQIGQLITNLVTNARDALDGRGGVIEIEVDVASDQAIENLRNFSNLANERLIGEPAPKARYARLSVSDNGNGIPPKILDRIFEPFFSTKGRQRGTGLGLAVVHGVVRAHEGFCHVKSEPGQGTVFSIYLPLIEDNPIASGLAGAGRLEPCRVLIVDDEADMADMLSIGLERLGFHTVAVQNPIAALSAIEEDPTAFDTLLTDQLMPGMRGTDLIREAKRVAPTLRAVLCTANAEKMTEAEALTLGADAVIYKPVEIQAVAEAISQASKDQQ